MKNRFDLEQEIMECWNVTGDMDDLYSYVMNGGDNAEFDRDKAANILLGLIQLYDLKFNKLFSTFEQCLERKEFKPLNFV
jgi:hypothetical protein